MKDMYVECVNFLVLICCCLYVKEYRSRSVAVLTPSYGLALSILGIRPTYKMRNISELSEQIYSKLSGFLATAICGSCAKNYRNHGCQFWGRGWEIFFKIPHISANFGSRELKIYMPLNLHQPHIHTEFCDPNHKNGARGTIVEIKNFSCSKGCRFPFKVYLRWLREH